MAKSMGWHAAALFVAALGAAGISQPSRAADSPPATGQSVHHRVVFQVSDASPQKWNLTLNNAKNLRQALGRSVAIEIVNYGPGIGMLKSNSVVGERVANAVRHGVKVVACENTMKAQHLTKADMLPTIGYVPGGVVEIMKREAEGWSYIKP
ncbi:MAG: DsrE family protein [Betaproteobacteria bacterium]|nr:DsrE family protein [Betaproteobacteria bacterium]